MPPKMILGLCILLWGGQTRLGAEPREAEYYPITDLQPPAGVVLEVGALEMLPGDRLAVGTRRGEIWLVDEPYGDPQRMKWTRWAQGLHEVLGLAYRDGWLYVTQKCDVSRLQDTNGDDRADRFEVFADDWGLSADHHEYAFGSKFDREGNLWVVLCLTGSFTSEVKYRGWCLRVTPEGRVIPTCSGIRSPGGIGMNLRGDMFYTDNQGPWNGTCSLKHLAPGKFMGNPAGNRWYELPEVQAVMGPRPPDPTSGSRFLTEAEKIPQFEPPVILFPYKKMGQSASGIVCDTTAGRFGPFTEQLFVGDQTNSTVMRCDLERVQGHYQGACFPFLEGFASGCVALLLTPSGTLFVGSTNRGWASRGPAPFGLQRVTWTGKLPFEIVRMQALPRGFRFRFTQPIDAEAARRPESWRLQAYTYIYQAAYGSPEVDFFTPEIETLTPHDDQLGVDLLLREIKPGLIYEVVAHGVRSQQGEPLLHAEAYYTLNRLPTAEP
ncbi:MAG: hypothetical protein KatS3mg114_0718 [Planctomycetaceae bacterium]|nr:MAG: hypothetical protein KatS3mg114_0718 [Planctomycetaceae bacterium]